MPGLFMRLGLKSLAVKKAISLPERVYQAGYDKTCKLFGGNFSAYICYLISSDKEENKARTPVKDTKVMSAIDEIMNIGKEG